MILCASCVGCSFENLESSMPEGITRRGLVAPDTVGPASGTTIAHSCGNECSPVIVNVRAAEGATLDGVRVHSVGDCTRGLKRKFYDSLVPPNADSDGRLGSTGSGQTTGKGMLLQVCLRFGVDTFMSVTTFGLLCAECFAKEAESCMQAGVMQKGFDNVASGGSTSGANVTAGCQPECPSVPVTVTPSKVATLDAGKLYTVVKHVQRRKRKFCETLVTPNGNGGETSHSNNWDPTMREGILLQLSLCVVCS